MQKVMEITTKEWLDGIDSETHLDGSPVLKSSSSCHPFRDNDILGGGNFGYKDAIGCMAVHPQYEDMLSSDLSGRIYGVDVPSSSKIYSLQDSGDFYEIDTSGESFSNLRSGNAISSPAKGMNRFQAQGGDEFLYYAQETQIGRWNLSGTYPTGWTDNWQTGLNSTTEHQMHPFLDRLYICNSNEIDEISSDGSGAETYASGVLDFSSKYEATCLTDNGRELLIGLSSDSDSVNAKILFWDTNTNSWQHEWSIRQTSTIYSIKQISGNRYAALSPDGLFVFNRQQPPKLIYDEVGVLDEGYQECLHQHRQGVFFVTVSDEVMFYGQTQPEAPVALHNVAGLDNIQDAVGSGTTGIFILPIVGEEEHLTFWLGTGNASNSNILRPKVASGITQLPSSASFQSRLIDLQDSYYISRVDVVFGAPIITDRETAESIAFGGGAVWSEADEVEVKLVYPGGLSDTTNSGELVSIGSVSATNTQHLGETRVPLYVDNPRSIEELGFEIEITGGDPLIKRVIFYGEKADM